MTVLTCYLLLMFLLNCCNLGNLRWLINFLVVLSEVENIQSKCLPACSNDISSGISYQTFVKSRYGELGDVMCQMVISNGSRNYAVDFILTCINKNCSLSGYATSESKIFPDSGQNHYGDFPGLLQLTSNCTKVAINSRTQGHKDSDQTSERFSLLQSEIQSLRFKSNCISRFTTNYLCNLTNLKHLDLSCNALYDPMLLGFSSNCNLSCCSCNLTSLSLRENRIKNITGNLFCAFPNLRNLDLSYNTLASLHKEAFSYLANLEVLELSNNRLVTLPVSLFQPLKKLTKLSLTDNYLNETGELVLSYLENLITLNLERNKYKILPSALLKGLIKLQNLTMNYNFISELHDDFEFLNDLVSLDLSFNKLLTMSESTFHPLTNLKYLVLSGNKNIQIPAGAFSKSRNLNQLKLSKCILKQLPNIENMSNLTALDLSENEIENISFSDKNIFNTLYSLTTLNLRRNLIRVLASGAFDGILHLKVLKLDNNNISSIANVFQNSTIEELVLNNNIIRNFSFDFIPATLKLLDLRNNHISSIVQAYNIRNLNIRKLYLSGNNISNLDGFQIPSNILELNFDNNQISSISFVKYDSNQSFLFNNNATRVSLRNNDLISICSPLLHLIHSKVVPVFDVRENPINCACELTFKNKLFLADPSPSVPKSSLCASSLNSSSLDEQLTCDIMDKTNLPCQCNLLDDYNNICRLPCPIHCFCHIDKSFSIHYINCRNRNLTAILPMETTILQANVTFSYNLLWKISSLDLVPFSNAISLHLDHNVLETVGEDAFGYLASVRALNLASNRLTNLPPGLFDTLTHLEELNLRDNRLSFLDPSDFLPLVSLQVLMLDHNLLSDFQVWKLPPWNATFRLSLSENPWSCNCTFVENFRSWLQKSVSIVSDAEDLHCVSSLNDSAEADYSFIFFNSSQCFSPKVRILTLSDVTMLVTTLIGFLALVASAVLIFIYRREIQVLLYSKYGIRLLSNKVDDEDKTYDAILAYSDSDEEFAFNNLCPKLEEIENPYSIWIRQRDTLAGSFFTDGIQQAVDISCRTIVILTDTFLECQWCVFLFKTAYHKMLTDRCNRVIVILKEKLTKEMDPDIKLYMKTNTYLTWGDKLFWEKLYFEMPEKRVVNEITRIRI